MSKCPSDDVIVIGIVSPILSCITLMIAARTSSMSITISIETFVKACATNPAKRFGLEGRGKIKEGYFADLVVADMNLEKEVKREEQHTKCGWSPYEGMILKGWPVMTFVNGNLVYDTKKFYENDGEDLFP